uniref:Zinc ribbon domain containing 2 n=1 Tax=Anguilla anguilla TaxID=7936 RepID=A0A0E9X1V3_ANGAN
MGDYLLKGYKMLGECCEQCGTILLQDKQKKNYCVACQELDSDIDKDNPALNAQAALSQVRERQLAAHPLPLVNGTTPSDSSPSVPGLPHPEHCEGVASGLRGPLPEQPNTTSSLPGPAPSLPTTSPSQSAEQVPSSFAGPPLHHILRGRGSPAEDAMGIAGAAAF